MSKKNRTSKKFFIDLTFQDVNFYKTGYSIAIDNDHHKYLNVIK